MASLELSPAGRRYGRIMPAPLPEHRMLTRKLLAAYPTAVDLTAARGPIKDQGQEGSCTAHAGTSTGEWIFRRYLNQSPIFSPAYTYSKELIANGDFPDDNGSDGVTLCNTIITNGMCEESVDPYQAGQIKQPTPAQDANAASFRLGAYHGLTDSETVLSVLGDPTPWPVLIGFDVYESFESDEMASTGIMPIPSSSEKLLGGHEVACTCGYDIGATATLRPANCPPAIWIQNSWGTSWGITGTFWMPLAILDAANTDLKIAHSGKPWK